MVNAGDLKSPGLHALVSSSLTPGTPYYWVQAPPLDSPSNGEPMIVNVSEWLLAWPLTA